MAEVIYLDSMRQGRSVPVMPLMHRQNPEKMIRQAADRSLIDKVREWVECADAVCEDEPLAPRDRVTLMRLVATIHPEPRG